MFQAHHAYLDAMVEGDTPSLDDLLDEGLTPTHMTGYVQPTAEWLAEMKAGQFVYHSIGEVDTTLDLDGGTARLTVRTMTDAKVYGSRADWRLLPITDPLAVIRWPAAVNSTASGRTPVVALPLGERPVANGAAPSGCGPPPTGLVSGLLGKLCGDTHHGGFEVHEHEMSRSSHDAKPTCRPLVRSSPTSISPGNDANPSTTETAVPEPRPRT
ncbi:nuclear transport factor 2 family protein [Streptomyces sp. NPDC056730]|uniref:nuclear transport factor 2 family protein n=1 Tax=unclassified Streptomyces TaxID=2593676 RepID=UPI003674A954